MNRPDDHLALAAELVDAVAYHPLIHKLSTFADLSVDEQNAIVDVIGRTAEFTAGEDIILRGDQTGGIRLLLNGFAARYKILEDGRRQILAFLLPGDFCNLHASLLKHLDHSVVALSPSQVSIIPQGSMDDLMAKWPKVARALWWSTLREEAITREWVVNIGQRTAYERMAHLFCELFYRMRAAGKVEDKTFQLPLTQSVLADTLGLSSVHTNRTLQDLRRGGLITFRSGVLTVRNLPALEKAAFFSSDYLHMERAAVA